MGPSLTRAEWRPADATISVLSTGIVLAAFLIRIRTRLILGWHLLRPPSLLDQAPYLPAVTFEDLLYVTLLTGSALLAIRLACRRPRLLLAVRALFPVLAVFSLVMAVVNVRAITDLGRSVNYQWLYYSDFLRSLDAYNALGAVISRSWLLGTAGLAIGLLIVSYLLARTVRSLAPQVRAPWLAPAAGLGLAAYLAWSARWSPRAPQDHALLANPVMAFVGSLVTADAAPPLATRRTSADSADFLPIGERAGSAGRSPLSGAARAAGVRNVVVVVLESVGAEYLDPYGARYGATPELSRYSRDATRFANAYAHVPGTTYSLVSLLLSIYPKHSFRSITREYPRIEAASLSAELKRQGYRTAFLNADENRFQRSDEFLNGRGFDQVLDAEAFPCTLAELAARGQDACLSAAFGAWLDASPARPFFAMLWTIQTHYPYFAPGPTTDFGVRDTMLNRYLNALHQSDRAVGGLMRMLDERRLLDSTLVVVVGDHGEAFRQHGQIVHRLLYEEDVHIPLLLVNRRLFHGETDSVVGGMIDLAPTVLDLLGYPLPERWQGASLFDPGRSGRVYLFGPYSGLFGYRDGSRKLIYQALNDSTELYDLATDPGERVNLAPHSPEAVREGGERLAAWVQFQNRFLKDRLVPSAR
jgi:arylsulfatase A-like enzyme